MTAWTDERLQLAIKLRLEGHSCSVIGTRLGVSRNAVIGKLHREGVGSELKPMRRSSKTHSTRNRKAKIKPWRVLEVRKSAKLFEAEAYVPGPELVIPEKERKGVLDLAENDCRWPIGDPQEKDFHFCSRQQVPGLPYCDHHCRRAFRPPEARRDISTWFTKAEKQDA